MQKKSWKRLTDYSNSAELKDSYIKEISDKINTLA